MPFLEIHLLGPPCVYWAGNPLHIPRRQARSLLYRLAVRLQPVPREHLCFLFWSDRPEWIARRNLSHLLTHLRRALPAPDEILAMDDQISLNPHLVWSDSAAFEQLHAVHEQRPHMQTFREIVDLYRGEFLTGFSMPSCPDFESWMTLERRIWERHFLELLAVMVEERIAAGSHAEAIDLIRQYLTINPLDEEMHCRLIELYALTGDRGAALRQYKQCVDALARDLGITPLPETKALYWAAMDGALTKIDTGVRNGQAILVADQEPRRSE